MRGTKDENEKQRSDSGGVEAGFGHIFGAFGSIKEWKLSEQ